MLGLAVLASVLASVLACEPKDAEFSTRVLDTDGLASSMEEHGAGAFLVDVRTAAEFATGAIPGAINIPYDLIAASPPTTDLGARIIVYCRSGRRSGLAKSALEKAGYTAVNDFGSVSNWRGELVVTE